MTIVAVSGGFDPLHIGHVRMIRAARRLGDKVKLIVILNNDSFLLRKKGYVFMPLEERREILRALKGVDRVVIARDTDETVCETLRIIRPDIFANGGDRMTPHPREDAVCQEIGCRQVFGVGGGKVQSSSRLVEGQKKASS